MLLFIFRIFFERDGAKLPSECKDQTKRKKSTPAITTTTAKAASANVCQIDKQKRGNLATDKHAASSCSSPPFRKQTYENTGIELKEYPAHFER